MVEKTFTLLKNFIYDQIDVNFDERLQFLSLASKKLQNFNVTGE